MEIPVNGLYYHYKHDAVKGFNDHAYEVIGLARHTENASILVLYRPLYKNEWLSPAKYCVRPIEMFTEDTGESLKRFTLITDIELISKLTEIKNQLYS